MASLLQARVMLPVNSRQDMKCVHSNEQNVEISTVYSTSAFLVFLPVLFQRFMSLHDLLNSIFEVLEVSEDWFASTPEIMRNGFRFSIQRNSDLDSRRIGHDTRTILVCSVVQVSIALIQ